MVTGLSTPKEIQFIFSYAIVEWEKCIFQTDIFIKRLMLEIA